MEVTTHTHTHNTHTHTGGNHTHSILPYLSAGDLELRMTAATGSSQPFLQTTSTVTRGSCPCE